MSRREDIDNGIWSDPDFDALSAEAGLLYLWSFTNPRCGMAGLYKVSRRALLESKVSEEKLDGALAELEDARFAFYKDGVLFVRSRVKHLRTRTVQIAKSIAADVSKVGEDHPLRAAWVAENAGAGWLERFESEGHVTFSRTSTEGQDSSSPGEILTLTRTSPEGHVTLQGKGKGREEGGPGETSGKVLTFRGVRVSDEQRILAEAILAEFNKQAETGYGPYRGDGRPSEDLKRIVGALRDADPPLSLDEARRVIAWRLRNPFWQGKPHTGVVFGPNVFGSNRESARSPGGGRGMSSVDFAAEMNRGLSA